MEEEKIIEIKKETPSEIHAELLRIMTTVFFMATAGIHYQVSISKYFSIISLILKSAGYLSQKNIFCSNEFKTEDDLNFGKSLINKFSKIYSDWSDDSYNIPFYYAVKYQNISDNKVWNELITDVEKMTHNGEMLKNNFEQYSYEED